MRKSVGNTKRGLPQSKIHRCLTAAGKRIRPVFRTGLWSLDILQTEIGPIPKGLNQSAQTEIGPIPKGLNQSAQGCARRATLGVCAQIYLHPVRVASPPRPIHSHRHAAIIGQDSRAYRLLRQRPPSIAARNRATGHELHHYLGGILKLKVCVGLTAVKGTNDATLPMN
jgi:hypothetical protein